MKTLHSLVNRYGLQFLTIATCLFAHFELLAQNSSYNTNNIPIGGATSVAFGFEALKVNIGSNNTALGFNALTSNTTGGSNTAVGQLALFANSTGHSNTANGIMALYSNTTGSENLASGIWSLYSNTTGIRNIAIGSSALVKNIDGNSNIALGSSALLSNVTGGSNIAIGSSAGYNSLGNNNIFIGNGAGYSEAGSNKLYIGNSDDNTIIYGDISTGQLLVGKPDATGYTFKGSRKLNVLGGILTDSVRVALSTGWADYVFDEEYKLMPLSELETFIKENNHLPGIPTAVEVASNGIELGDLNAKLLAKIEELTLYQVQQQKKIEELTAIVNSLKK